MGPKLIVVTGLAASGKTWLAGELARAFQIPLIPKDPIKVELLTQLGVRDRAWDIEIGTAAVRVQMLLANELLSKGLPVILESTFKQEYDGPLLAKLIAATDCDCLQLLCGARGDLLVERYLARTEAGSRPKELNEADNREEFKTKLQKGFSEPLDLPGKLIRIDTSHFEQVDLPALKAEAREFLMRVDRPGHLLP